MGSEEVIQRLCEMDVIRQPIMNRMIDSLNLPPSSRGLDVGCGLGLQTVLLAEKVGPKGHVTGLDLDQALLEAASQLTGQTKLNGQIDFKQGSFNQLPFEDHAFDWLWSADCVGYPIGDMQSVLPELLRVVKPCGSVFISAWTSQQILPGYPLLENRSNAEYSAFNPYLKGVKPENHFLNMKHWFKLFNLEQIQVKTFAIEFQAPLSPVEQKALASLYAMLWVRPESSSNEWHDFDRLCTMGSGYFLPSRNDFFGFYTYTMFRATKK